MISDYESFITGIQVGRRIKMWDASKVVPRQKKQGRLITEDKDPITTEQGDYLVTEQMFSEVIPE